MIRINREKRQ